MDSLKDHITTHKSTMIESDVKSFLRSLLIA